MSSANLTDDDDGLRPEGCEDHSDEDQDGSDDDEDFDHDQQSVDLSVLLPPSPAPLLRRPVARPVAEVAGRRERAGRFAPQPSIDVCPAQRSGQLYEPPLAATLRNGIVVLASNCAPATATSVAARKVKVVKQKVAGDVGGGLRKSWLPLPPPPPASPPSLLAVVPRQPQRRTQAFASSLRLGGSARRSCCLASRIGAGSSYGTRFSRDARALTQCAAAATSGSASLLAVSDIAGTAKMLHLR